MDIADAEFENNNFIIKLQIVLQSATLEKYLLNNQCCIYIGYITDTARRMIRVNNPHEHFALQIPVSSLKSVDTINVYSYIIAEECFEMDYTDEMDQNYNIGEPMFITKKDI